MIYDADLLDIIDEYASQLEEGDIRLDEIVEINQRNMAHIIVYCELQHLKEKKYLGIYHKKWTQALKRYNDERGY